MAAFFERLRPAPVGGGFAMEGYWVWCGSPIRGDDGQYHLFASRWRSDVRFSPHWLTHSEVVRAVSPTPEGPYAFADVVLPPRGTPHWDGRMTHNPTIHRHGNTFLLFYTGTTYSGPTPTPERQIRRGDPQMLEARANQRIGLATAPSPVGPWTRPDAPILAPRPGKWDALMTTNPAPCVRDDGSVLLVYKSTGSHDDLLRLGVAAAQHPAGPYERLSDTPILTFDATGDHVEDPYLWHSGERYEMLMKDMNGGICGEKHGGVHATSADGVTWMISAPPLAYSRTVRWDDGTVTALGSCRTINPPTCSRRHRTAPAASSAGRAHGQW